MGDRTTDTQQRDVAKTNGFAQMGTEDSFEYRLLKSYTEKKEATFPRLPQSNGASKEKAASPVPSDEDKKAAKKRRRSIKFRKLISCIQPQKEDRSPAGEDHRRRAASCDARPDAEVDDIVNKLAKITASVQFLPSELETDSDDIIEQIVDMIREHGDRLDEEIRNNPVLIQQLQGLLSYNYFAKVAKAFLSKFSPEEVPPATPLKQARIAVIFELISRLKTMDCHPMNRVLGFGAKYLQDYCSIWVNQQGGYAKVFCPDDEEEVQ